MDSAPRFRKEVPTNLLNPQLFQDRLLEALLLLIPSGLITALVYLYLNAGKPAKKVHIHIRIIMVTHQQLFEFYSQAGGETILLLNSKGDWEYAPSAKRTARVKF